VLIEDGHVYCSGAGAGDSQSGGPDGSDGHVQGIDDAFDLAAGFEHTCAVLRDHPVRRWGQNERGQLGDGTNDDSALPINVLGAEHVTNVQCGRDHRYDDGSISRSGPTNTVSSETET
jgi:alpha-tubulin suppressor-like RCC1 family protein